MLYWVPPDKQIDVVGQHEGSWVVQGLGKAQPKGEPVTKQWKNPVMWQWFQLNFGQSVLVKRYPEARMLDKALIPTEYTTEIKGHDRISIKTKPSGFTSVSNYIKSLDINSAVNKCIESDFKEQVIGAMLAQLAKQDNGIEKAVSFSGVIARQLIVRSGKYSSNIELQNRIIDYLRNQEEMRIVPNPHGSAIYAKFLSKILQVPLSNLLDEIIALEQQGKIRVLRTVRDMSNPSLRLNENKTTL
jgi:hypothetical protein